MLTTCDSRIAAANDRFRATFTGGRVIMSIGVAALGALAINEAIALVRRFNNFEPCDREHSFGTVRVAGHSIVWVIDYFALDYSAGADDPCDASATARILTIMLEKEY